MHRWNISLIQVLSMLAYHRLKRWNLPIKSQAFLTGRHFCVGVAGDFSSFGRTALQHSPGRAASKACWLTWFIRKIPKILRVFEQDVPYVLWKRTFKRNDDLSTTCQCRQLKLNPLSTQINIYCLMTNQTPALLVQRAPWTRAAVMLLQSLYFSRPPPPRAIIPDDLPLGTFENQDGRD